MGVRGCIWIGGRTTVNFPGESGKGIQTQSRIVKEEAQIGWWSFSISPNSIYVPFFNRKSFHKMLLNNSCQIDTNLCVSPGSSSIAALRYEMSFLLGPLRGCWMAVGVAGEGVDRLFCLSFGLLMPSGGR